MYIRDKKSNKMYAIESAEGQALLGNKPVVIQSDLEVRFNTDPYSLNKEDHIELAEGLDLVLNMRMKESTMIKKINEHIEAGG